MRLVEYPTSRDEAEQIARQIAELTQSGSRSPRDFAIFYRVNSLSRPFETALRTAGVPYQVVHGVEFYQRKEVKDILAYLHLINNPRNDVAFARVINTPPRKIGKTTIQRLANHAQRSGLSLLDAARQAGLVPALAKRAAVHVAEFVAVYDRLSLHAAAPLEEIMGTCLEDRLRRVAAGHRGTRRNASGWRTSANCSTRRGNSTSSIPATIRWRSFSNSPPWSATRTIGNSSATASRS